MSEKTEKNYTAETTAAIVAAYVDAGTGTTPADHEKRAAVVDELVIKFGKGKRSIRSKLVREGVYIAKETVSKVTGEKPAKKSELAETLVKVSGLNVSADSIAKMNKTTIQAFITAFESTAETTAEAIAEASEKVAEAIAEVDVEVEAETN